MNNIAQTAPPETLRINEKDYAVLTDFCVWISILDLLQDMDFTGREELLKHNSACVLRIEKLAFGCIINEPISDVLLAVVTFLKGYKTECGEAEAVDDEPPSRLFSFTHDLNYIVLAIRNQSGIDLTYRREQPFHWWLFLLEFRTLTEAHYIIRLIQLRAYKGDDKEHLRLQKRAALPPLCTHGDEMLIAEMNRLFYNT